MEATDEFYLVVGFYLVLFFIIYNTSAVPLSILIIDKVDYNVTFNATDNREYPNESIEFNEIRIPTAIGEIIINNNATIDISDIEIIIKQYRRPRKPSLSLIATRF